MNRYLKNVVMGIEMLFLAFIIVACDGTTNTSNNPAGSSRNLKAFQSIAGGSALSLGLAETFAVFGGGAGVTNQGTGTVITGDMGTTGASTMITGFHSSSFSYSETPLNVGTVNGMMYTDAPEGTVATFEIATETAADILTAFNNLAAIPDGIDPGAGQLGGLTLVPGVYKSAAGSFLITGSDLTLDAQGNAEAV
jgi:hypothetical protein